MGMLEPSFGEPPPGLTEENLQSRIRGVILWRCRTSFGWLVLTTGNKSESSVGYSTLYGDSAGGFAVIKDVPKLLVYELCRYRNAGRGPARSSRSGAHQAAVGRAAARPARRPEPPALRGPRSRSSRPTSSRTCAAEDIVAAGYDPAIVDRIVRLVDLAEYKRRQSPPGVRIHAKAFGKDRRLPITNRYRG